MKWHLGNKNTTREIIFKNGIGPEFENANSNLIMT